MSQVVKCTRCLCVSVWMCASLMACDRAELGDEVAPVAMSVQPEQPGATLEPDPPSKAHQDSVLLPGSGLVPTFEAPSASTVPSWRWVYEAGNESHLGLAQDTASMGEGTPDEYHCSFLGKKVGVMCIKGSPDAVRTGTEGWDVRFDEEPFLGAGQMLIHDGSLYVVHHSFIATGARMSAFDVRSGERQWSVSLKGLTDISHSRYRNETFLEFDAATDSLLIFGKESGGGYVERRALKMGELLAHRDVDAWTVNHSRKAPIMSDESGSRSYTNRESTTHPGATERLIMSSDGEQLALHIWPKP